MTVLRFLKAKLKDPSTYVLALIVGTVINVYGQFLVPLFRGDVNPIDTIIFQYAKSPRLFLASVAVAYLFPMFVGIYSSVRTQYGLRHAVSKAEFPDNKPDPVFRTATDADGQIISSGEATKTFLRKYFFRTAVDIIGRDTWQHILDTNKRGESSSSALKIYVKACDEEFLISHSPAKDNAVNVYLTRMTG